MHNAQPYLRKLIHEMLLQEDVYGAMATVYHGSEMQPWDIVAKDGTTIPGFIPMIVNDKFDPGSGSGALYGKGLYTVYDLDKTLTSKGEYGKYIYKFGVHLNGFVSFDPVITKLIYKSALAPADQAREAGYDDYIIEMLEALPHEKGKYTSETALKASVFLKGQVKGIVFTGKQDGHVALIYDVGTVVPLSWKLAKSAGWNRIDRESLKPSISRFSSRSWTSAKYETSSIAKLRNAIKMPPGERVIDGDLRLRAFPLRLLPDDLAISGNAELNGTALTKLPNNLRVDGGLYLQDTNIKELPNGLVVGGTLNLENVPITSLSADLQVNGDLILHGTQITSLPDNLNVNGSLNLGKTPLTSLPTGLRVKRDLTVRDTQITVLPDDIIVGGFVYGFKGDPANVPAGIKLFTLY